MAYVLGVSIALGYGVLTIWLMRRDHRRMEEERMRRDLNYAMQKATEAIGLRMLPAFRQFGVSMEEAQKSLAKFAETLKRLDFGKDLK